MPQSLVIIADDDDLLRSLVEFKLTARGYRVMSTGDGEEALSMIQEQKPDLVVLDAIMPGADGFEVLRRMKSELGLASTPVVMLSARRQESDIVEALQLGANDYVVKPFVPEELARRVARLVPPGPS